MNKPEQKISVDEMAEALGRSGYLLEGRVFRALTKAGFHVHTNIGYPDPETGISREIDVEAYSFFADQKTRHQIHIVFVCECENNRTPIVFFETEGRQSRIHASVVRCAGAPTRIWMSGRSKPIEEALGFRSFHHYANGLVATQYCSFTKPKDKGRDWIAQHPEYQHETFTKLTDALQFKQSRPHVRFDSNTVDQDPAACLIFYYPILVLQGELYVAKGRGRIPKLSKVPHVQYRRHVSTSKGEGTFQIDVIQESHLPKFVGMIFGEVEEIINRLSKREGAVKRSLRRMLGGTNASEVPPLPAAH